MIKRVVKLLIALAFWLLENLLILGRRNNKSGTCVVLMYHAVSAEQLHRFIRQMEKVTKLTIPVAADAITNLARGKLYCTVTFDDGFASTIDTVLPVLNQMSIPATFFIPTAYWGKEATWITDNNRRQRVGCVITAEKLKQFSEHRCVTIGSHGINHVRLTEVSDDDAWKELAESKKILEEITGKNIKTHSFPFGCYYDRHVEMALNAGYERVFTVDPNVATGGSNEFLIGRIEVDPADWQLEFTLKLMGAYRWQPHASRLKKLLRRYVRNN